MVKPIPATGQSGCGSARGHFIVIAWSDSDEAIQTAAPETVWIASLSLSSGAHSRDPLARNDNEAAA